ncbi:MAG: DUF2806 domain-containing protein [Betaproteobacteria bacterium]|nr:DUF2806 domain-containing protein [Betaproteobacteria bacterium]NBP45300.1 DUF2806 domain-containing protein [Betaproteobacteria bacterium]
MSEGNSVINLGDFSKTATVLVEKVSAAVGAFYEPIHVKRMARAEAEAEKIKAIAKIELTEIEQRALERFLHQEARKQANIEQITVQAATSLPPDAKVENLEEDWVAHFFKQCDTVSDREMQSLWARLLSGEATRPGTFSKRTVDFTSTIDKKDAALFTTFCQFVWMADEPTPLIYEFTDEIYTKQGITFDALKHLEAIGLIALESVSEYGKKGFAKYGHFFYYGMHTVVEFSGESNNLIPIGKALLTNIGKELAPICGPSKNNEFYHYVIRRWFNRGLVLSSIISSSDET